MAQTGSGEDDLTGSSFEEELLDDNLSLNCSILLDLLLGLVFDAIIVIFQTWAKIEMLLNLNVK